MSTTKAGVIAMGLVLIGVAVAKAGMEGLGALIMLIAAVGFFAVAIRIHPPRWPQARSFRRH